MYKVQTEHKRQSERLLNKDNLFEYSFACLGKIYKVRVQKNTMGLTQLMSPNTHKLVYQQPPSPVNSHNSRKILQKYYSATSIMLNDIPGVKTSTRSSPDVRCKRTLIVKFPVPEFE